MIVYLTKQELHDFFCLPGEVRAVNSLVQSVMPSMVNAIFQPSPLWTALNSKKAVSISGGSVKFPVDWGNKP